MSHEAEFADQDLEEVAEELWTLAEDGRDRIEDLRATSQVKRLDDALAELQARGLVRLGAGRLSLTRAGRVLAEGQVRRLLGFLDLPWDDRCLRFHENKRAVATASNAQVRQPIYASSVGRWRHYEKHLGELVAALGAGAKAGAGAGAGAATGPFPKSR